VYEITLASSADIDGITALLLANSPSRGGSLTGEFPRDKVAAMALHAGPVMVAHRAGEVVGVLFSAAKDHAAPPVVQAMLAAWPGREDAYTYGPVCIADSERGQGLLARLYDELQRHRCARMSGSACTRLRGLFSMASTMPCSAIVTDRHTHRRLTLWIGCSTSICSN
jgi:hypothetical protein